MKGELTEQYVNDLRKTYVGRVPGSADLVLFWFEKSRALVAQGTVSRVGLIGTQAIRGGENRKVLNAIKASGDIFWARSDKKWPKPNGKAAGKKAMVQVSMVAFDNGSELERELDEIPVVTINSNLTAGLDTTKALRLKENAGMAFQGPVKVGKFEIGARIARQMFSAPNPNGKPNHEVIRPWMNGNDIKLRPKDRFIIDFAGRSFKDAALYEMPFEYIRVNVFPARQKNKNRKRKDEWWRHGRSGKELTKATNKLHRFAITTRHSKHRIFLWAKGDLLPDSALVAVATDSDYLFGILHSTLHERWARAQGTQVRSAESGFRYTPKSCFDTFPFPWPPGADPSEDESPLVKAIAEAARELVRLREAWLNPPNASEVDLKERTLTKLYNKRPAWLENAHQTLDRAVFAAYGLSYPLSREEIIRHLLELNRERAAGHVRVLSLDLPPKKSPGVERLPKQRPSKFGS